MTPLIVTATAKTPSMTTPTIRNLWSVAVGHGASVATTLKALLRASKDYRQMKRRLQAKLLITYSTELGQHGKVINSKSIFKNLRDRELGGELLALFVGMAGARIVRSSQPTSPYQRQQLAAIDSARALMRVLEEREKLRGLKTADVDVEEVKKQLNVFEASLTGGQEKEP